MSLRNQKHRALRRHIAQPNGKWQSFAWRRRSDAYVELAAREALQHLQSDSSSKIVLEWDNKTSAFGAFGELLQLLGLAQMLAFAEIPVCFRFVHSGTIRQKNLDRFTSAGLSVDGWNSEARALVRQFESAGVETEFSDIPFDELPSSEKEGKHWLAPEALERLGLYRLSYQLIWAFWQMLPLDASEFREKQLAAPRGFIEERFGSGPPFIAWHVRRAAAWDSERTSLDDELVADFLDLSTFKPGREIRVFSTEAGVLNVLDALDKNLSGSQRALMEQVKPQRAANFVEAALEVKFSEFYFQRRGGGLGIAAELSNTPSLMLNEWVLYRWPNQEGQASPPWARPDQLAWTGRDVTREPFSKFVVLPQRD